MILLDTILREAINPALAMLPVNMDTPDARVMLLAIGLQESRFMYRYQKLVGQPYRKGPALGYWQFEKGGGVQGVLNHPSSMLHARDICASRNVLPTADDVWPELETDDILAAAFARLLLWTDRAPMPKTTASHDEAWNCYYRCWRPGLPKRDTWDEFHAQAVGQVVA